MAMLPMYIWEELEKELMNAQKKRRENMNLFYCNVKL